MNPTKRLAVAALALLLPFATASGQEADQPEPNIALDVTTLDYGKLWDPTKETKQVTISNTGDADLLLSNLASTCGCTVPRIGEETLVKAKGTAIDVRIKPGESVVMDVTVNTFGKRDKLAQKVTITSNDPDTPEAYVDVVGFVEPQVRVEPWMLDLGQLEKGESVTHAVKVTTREPTFKLRRISFGGDRSFKSKKLDTKNIEIEGQKRVQANFEIIFLGSTKPGSKMVEATLRTNHKQQRLLTMQIRYEILGDLNMPKVLTLGTLSPNAPVDRTFKVTSRSGKPFKVLGVRHKGEEGPAVDFTAVANDAEKPTEYDVTVHLTHVPERGSMRGTLIVATDVLDEEALELRYQGVVLVAPPKEDK
jgi:Protein of unknown function (DUF1573)